ncbi:hypothetical protein DL89DRAFT_255627 [Linderina pennispora]|uniref:Uncharacterized protein n=1 Tax=Linderina pennispora TaxID=61395 RepID=A0A1Y1WEF8_9FUNG|nr:uncharacterized protein DL89DRAFT_255627 [Linderina pennispora]ORX71909.1 hypothetical protein DL89DRAFT_255627 [Linderina pennispora]
MARYLASGTRALSADTATATRTSVPTRTTTPSPLGTCAYAAPAHPHSLRRMQHLWAMAGQSTAVHVAAETCATTDSCHRQDTVPGRCSWLPSFDAVPLAGCSQMPLPERVTTSPEPLSTHRMCWTWSGMSNLPPCTVLGAPTALTCQYHTVLSVALLTAAMTNPVLRNHLANCAHILALPLLPCAGIAGKFEIYLSYSLALTFQINKNQYQPANPNAYDTIYTVVHPPCASHIAKERMRALTH